MLLPKEYRDLDEKAIFLRLDFDLLKDRLDIKNFP